MSRVYVEDNSWNFFLVILAILLFIFVVVVFASPGMLFLCTLRSIFGFHLDKGQMWVFSLLACGGIFTAIHWGGKRFLPASTPTLVLSESASETSKDAADESAPVGMLVYFGLAILTTIVCLICHFGFHAHFPGEFLSWYFG